MSTTKGDAVGKGLLDAIIDWVYSNLNPEDVFDSDTLSDWAAGEGYIHEDYMDDWAVNNGYVKSTE